MFGTLARKIFGTTNDRMIRHYQGKVNAINALEATYRALSDDALKAKTQEFKMRLDNGAPLDQLLPDAFATVREAAQRVLGMRHFDVQLIGGMVLHEGRISEMKTGEGKTLVATLPAYLNALTGKGVHIVTVNDYLAKRDAEWMGKLFRFLGLTVGVIVHDLNDWDRKQAYDCDITYGTNNELGFDYLRDNMKYSREQMVQRPFHYAIIDEVDSILIDEARTPLIISGPTEDNSALYIEADKIMKHVKPEHYEHDEKSKSVTLNEEGTEYIEGVLAEKGLLEAGSSLYDIANISLVHHVTQSLRAHVMFHKDVDYIIKDKRVMIIDEFTGRIMDGRRYSEGLHQALEAKEGVPIQNENQTLASITFQNYFRLYPKLSGMTGTAMTEEGEFSDIYGLEVAEIPTNVPVARLDSDDEIYRTAREKYEAIITLLRDCYERKQPVLVGTVSIEKSELLSEMLKKAKIPHNVLNARHHEKEAHIVAQAGRPGAITIATNMAGRGTDIKLGGNIEMRIEEEASKIEDEKKRAALIEKIAAEIETARQEVLAAGGLFVLGTERHESRRIDNQLRGRSGRQGDPGGSKFYLSLEDDLMRIFGSERIDNMLQKLGLKEGEAIIHPWMNKAIERAQTKVEARNYEIRKNLLKFDNVMNDQRKVIYEQRIELMEAEDVSDTIAEMREDTNRTLIDACIPEKAFAEQWDTEHLANELFRIYGIHFPVADWAKEEGIAQDEIYARVDEATKQQITDKEIEYTANILRSVEKRLLLQTLDQLWKDHLLTLDHLRGGINLRAYGQKDPLNEYKQEAFSLFEHMLMQLREKVTERMAHLKIRVELPPESLDEIQPQQRMQESRHDPLLGGDELPMLANQPLHTRKRSADVDPADASTWGKVGRNDDCPCGSGKKFKHCHGQIT